ncbi:dynactin p62 family-domain-containing protein [Protomyces lactucae-debilis]|uniref:Dynactin subunit 4 n=1 Tax=Protomyces lactucae-debilis TaxID=2754530 RepID=A0A1Y2FEQ5_PROLT|nr:dynactin p62 family-domain-containing protein [Protomyces lactucae-debilis]ORY82087.1 dynactin p62 family-domain-containing protein [Protomyces lactucae-debilis]
MDTSNVRYHCPCADSPADQLGILPKFAKKSATDAEAVDPHSTDQEKSDTEDDKPVDISLLDSRLPFALHSLHDLYFCEDCGCARCPRCVMEEVSVLFCPNCLFEVPAKSSVTAVSAPEAVCGRSCFRCPLCFSALQAGESPGSSDATADRLFHLECPYCAWSSLSTRLTFTKANGMFKQMKEQHTSPRESAFRSAKIAAQARRDAFLDDEPDASLSSQLKRVSLSDTFTRDEQALSKSFIVPVLRPDEVDESFARDLLNATDLDDVPSIMQSSMQTAGPMHSIGQLMPLPTPLRTRRAKRCRACRHILCKFETRQPVMQAVKFRIRLAASNYLPTLTFSKVTAAATSNLTATEQSPPSEVYLLKIANPLYESIKVTLSAPRVTEFGHEVTVLAPEVIIGGFTDVWETQPSTTSGSMEETKPGKGSQAVLGRLHSSGSNWTNIEIHMARSGVAQTSAESDTHALIPLFVSMEYEIEAELDNSLSTRTASMSDGKTTKKVGFWTVLTAK